MINHFKIKKLYKKIANLGNIYMAHAVAFAAIRTTKTREHFCGKFLYNAIASTDNVQHKNCPSSGIDDRPGRDLFAQAEICSGNIYISIKSAGSRYTISLLVRYNVNLDLRFTL